MRSRILWAVGLLFPLACSSAPRFGEDLDAGDASADVVDAAQAADVAPSDAIAPSDASEDVTSDASDAGELVDAPADAPEDAQLDAGAQDADAQSLGGDVCPIFGSTTCAQGFEFRTHPDGGNTDYNCGAVTPHCPSGWTCWALDSLNKPHYATCP